MGDLSDEDFLNTLPDAPNVMYMMGFKFGSSLDWQRAFHLNSVVPYLVGSKYKDSKIVVFSSGNPYQHTSRFGSGCKEDVQLDPIGIYGWSIVARESAFRVTSEKNPNQKIAFGVYDCSASYLVFPGITKIICKVITTQIYRG